MSGFETTPFETIQSHCLAKPGAFEDYPWGDTVWKVKPKNKIFCFGGTTSMTVRATLDEQAALVQLPGIIPAPYLARHGWVNVDLTLEQNAELAMDLIDRSYELVVGKPVVKKGRKK
jgi:predicted DNA-binding protein (MmcQ/YjbR family)